MFIGLILSSISTVLVSESGFFFIPHSDLYFFPTISVRAERDTLRRTMCSDGISTPVHDGVLVSLKAGIVMAAPSAGKLSRIISLIKIQNEQDSCFLLFLMLGLCHGAVPHE